MGEGKRDVGVQTRFNLLGFHDAQLLRLSLERREDNRTDDLHLSLKLLTGTYPEWQYSDAHLSFLDCTYLKVDFDLGFKNVAGDAISSAECLGTSALRKELERGVMQHEVDPLREYWEFVIYLCPPGGRLHVFARDFLLDAVGPA